MTSFGLRFNNSSGARPSRSRVPGRKFDENMRVIKKFAQQCQVFFVFEVESDVALVAIDKFPPQAFAIAWVAPGHSSQRVSCVGALYFDDVGAEVGKVARAVWAR